MKNYAKIISAVFVSVFSLMFVFSLPAHAITGYGGEGGGGGGGGGGSSSGGGGGGGACSNQVSTPPGGFVVEVDSGSTLSNPAGQVTLSIRAGDALRMAISNTPTFEGASQELYVPTKVWNLADSNVGMHNLYFRFYNACGNSTPVVQTTFLYQPRNPQGQTDNSGGQVLGEKINVIDELIAGLRYGQRKEDVRKLQVALAGLGYMPSNWKATNYYGPATLAAVNRYVDSHDREIKGLIAQLKFGQSHPDVRRLQRLLKANGALAKDVRITSYYGRLTRAAVRTYLTAHP